MTPTATAKSDIANTDSATTASTAADPQSASDAEIGAAEIRESLRRPTASRSTAPFLRRMDSPIGRLELGSDGEAIVSLVIERDGSLPRDGDAEISTPVLEAAVSQLTEYFDGSRQVFDLPVALSGTEFQRTVWAELQSLRFGEVTSYGSIGAATGRPTAGRAVGGAIGANPVPIIVGCHRVLASDARITGYSGGDGIPTKVWLLDHEGIAHK